MKYKTLNKFRLSGNEDNVEYYKQCKHGFKDNCEKKKEKYNENFISVISDKVTQGNPWNVFENIKKEGNHLLNTITAAEWKEHFNTILNGPLDQFTNEELDQILEDVFKHKHKHS